MENRSQKKKNIELLEDIQLSLKGLLRETDELKRDIRYIKSQIQINEKVRQDLQELKQQQLMDKASSGWWWS
jgi:hypothetical protein